MPDDHATDAYTPQADPDAATIGPSAEPDASILPDLPGYEVLAELGRGGMGVVFQARQVRLNRPVAVKMILQGRYAGPDALARFRAEGEALARLQHPGVVQIHDFGVHDGRP